MWKPSEELGKVFMNMNGLQIYACHVSFRFGSGLDSWRSVGNSDIWGEGVILAFINTIFFMLLNYSLFLFAYFLWAELAFNSLFIHLCLLCDCCVILMDLRTLWRTPVLSLSATFIFFSKSCKTIMKWSQTAPAWAKSSFLFFFFNLKTILTYKVESLAKFVSHRGDPLCYDFISSQAPN